MNRTGHNTATLFVGTEVEHTPAYNKKTLFVVGIQDTDLIEAAYIAHACEHIYFGANQSFPKLDANSQEWLKWEEMILVFLNKGYLCTLDIDVGCVEGLLENSFVEYNNFIPMISVKLPYLQQLGYNATIKLDDVDFAKSNPGVWCHMLHDLKNRDKFTSWDRYTSDTVVR